MKKPNSDQAEKALLLRLEKKEKAKKRKMKVDGAANKRLAHIIKAKS
jgi:hypothetical protein